MEDEIQVKIKMTANAQIYNLKILKSDTIQAVKEKCEKETKIPPETQNLVYKGRILSNEKLVSDYKIDNDHTIILVKKHIPSSSGSTENKPTSQNTNTNTNTNTDNNNTNSNTNNSNNNTSSNNNNNNPNPFMGLGGNMPDLSQLGSLLGNIDPNELNNMMQNMGGLGNMGVNPNMIGQIFSNPMYMQMLTNLLQNPDMIQMALNSPQMRQMAQNNPQMQAFLNNPQLIQQILNPQTLQMVGSLFGNNNNNNNNGQNPQFDLSQMANMLGGMDLGQLGGLFGNMNNNTNNNDSNNNTGNIESNSSNNNNNDTGNNENFSNIGINDNNDANVDYKEKYKDQLAQMKDMGFVNEETNIQVLKQCSGNVQFAVEKLLNMLG